MKAQGKARYSRLEDSGFRLKCKEPYMKCGVQGVVKSTNVLNPISLHLSPMSTCRYMYLHRCLSLLQLLAFLRLMACTYLALSLAVPTRANQAVRPRTRLEIRLGLRLRLD